MSTAQLSVSMTAAISRCARCGHAKPRSWIVLLCQRCTRRAAR